MNRRLFITGLNELKHVVLQVLYEDQGNFPTPMAITMKIDVPQVEDLEGCKTTLIRGILAHLWDDGYAVYNSDYAGWQITEEGVKFIGGSQ